ncbi:MULTISPECIES: hypothetical protein [unclassified Streptomyces]|uniref:hypothetical protein n=1 Tax=unclassified Streptomyces TaxID=2593676 RepID=UPI00331DDF2F
MTHARAPRWTAGAALAAAALLVAAPAHAQGPAAAAPSVRPLARAFTPALAAATTATDPAAVVPASVVRASVVPASVVPEEAYEELAGSAAGSGRERPGRPVAEPAGPMAVPVTRPLRPERPALPERPEHPERREHPEHPGLRDGAAERPGSAQRPARPERPGLRERPELRERPGLRERTRPPPAHARPQASEVPAPSRRESVAKPTPEPTGSSAVEAMGTGPNERAADLAAHLLPLGTGFALMGLGLGFMGVRLRRGR